jgi:hypothetical protein
MDIDALTYGNKLLSVVLILVGHDERTVLYIIAVLWVATVIIYHWTE